MSTYPARPAIHVRMAECAWRSWIRSVFLWVSAVTVAKASPAPAVKSMWMSAVPVPVFTAFAMMVRNAAVLPTCLITATPERSEPVYIDTRTHVRAHASSHCVSLGFAHLQSDRQFSIGSPLQLIREL